MPDSITVSWNYLGMCSLLLTESSLWVHDCIAKCKPVLEARVLVIVLGTAGEPGTGDTDPFSRLRTKRNMKVGGDALSQNVYSEPLGCRLL
jgi:hypothetical protein